MIEKQTVFILGAGASKPYGYPVASELRMNIIRGLTDWLNELNVHNIYREQLETYRAEAAMLIRHFKKSNTQSIDLFLARSPQFSDIGKISIILAILKAEEKSCFGEDILTLNSNYLDWYSYLFGRMTETLIQPESYTSFSFNRVTFITFNYDRSLEQFLFESLSNSFSAAPKEKILEQIKSIPIYHVYGAIDGLSWQNKNYLSYKYPVKKLSIERLMKLKDNIHIVYETQSKKRAQIYDKILEAEKIYFLGFGYAKENLDAIGLSRVISERHNQYNTAKFMEIFGTAVGMNSLEISNAKKHIFQHVMNLDIQTTFENKDSFMLLREHLK